PCRVRRLILARVGGNLDDRVSEAAIAGAVQPRDEAKPEDGARTRAGDHELGRDGVGHGQVALAPVLERGQLELDPVAELFAGTQPRAAQVERLHCSSVALADVLTASG